jgi:hypothetical protein
MTCTISQLYFGKVLYMFRTHLLSIIRSLNTVFTALGICHTSYVNCLLVTVAYQGGVFKLPPPPKFQSFTKSNRIANSVENV